VRNKNQNPLLLLLLLLVGLVIGGVIGDIFQSSFKILGYSKTIGFEPVTVDLSVIKFTLGFLMSINLASIVGIILAVIIFTRL